MGLNAVLTVGSGIGFDAGGENHLLLIGLSAVVQLASGAGRVFFFLTGAN
jgi:hypothetical protein